MTLPDPFALTLVAARLAGLVLTAPVLGEGVVPAGVRAGLVGVLALALAPGVPRAAMDGMPGMLAVARLVAVEGAVGVMIGLTARLVFAGVQLGAQALAIQMGLDLARVVDPGTPAEDTLVAQALFLVSLLAFVAVDGHHALLRAILDSFRVAPVGAIVLGRPLLHDVVGQAGALFVIGVRVMAPVVAVLLLVQVALGVVARTLPHLNAFAIGIPIQVGVGLIVVGAALPFTVRFLEGRFAVLARTLGDLVGSLGALAHG
jgi:flagellar biosynthetic protein FliR